MTVVVIHMQTGGFTRVLCYSIATVIVYREEIAYVHYAALLETHAADT
jgi:hypothetical protein